MCVCVCVCVCVVAYGGTVNTLLIRNTQQDGVTKRYMA